MLRNCVATKRRNAIAKNVPVLIFLLYVATYVVTFSLQRLRRNSVFCEDKALLSVWKLTKSIGIDRKTHTVS
jgi:hypothetical protein